MSNGFTRRHMISLVSGAAMAPGALTPAAWAAPARATAARRKAPVIGLHQDRPYIDFTGEAERFTPSDGTHVGAGVARLGAEQFRWLNPFS